MSLAQSPLDVVLSRLRAEFGGAVVVVDQDPVRATLRIGGHEDGIVSIEVADAAIPSFVVSYPKESQKRDGRTHIDVQRFLAFLASLESSGASDLRLELRLWLRSRLRFRYRATCAGMACAGS